MKTIVITSQKGGSGKTTLTAHLAVAAEQSGDGPCVVIDTDPQQTLATWWNNREAEAPQLAPLKLIELSAKLAALAGAGYRYCFIDTPPALTEQNKSVIEVADLVLIPARPSPADLWSLGSTVDVVRAKGTPFAFILSQAKANARITLQSMSALSEHGHVLAVIHDRVDYAASMTDGRTAQEINAGGPCAAEIAELWSLTKKRLGELAKNSELANTGRVKAYA